MVAAVTCTLSKAAVRSWPMLWDVSNRPTVTGPLIATVLTPIWVQFTPSADIQD